MLDAATELLKLAINILTTARTTVVDVPVAAQSQDPTFERVQKNCEHSANAVCRQTSRCPRPCSHHSNCGCNRRDATDSAHRHGHRCAGWIATTSRLVKIISGRVQQRSLKQDVDVPVPPATAQECASDTTFFETDRDLASWR